MKKIIYIILITSALLFLSCAVNESSGLIKVENKTSTALKNVKIGDRLIVYQVNPGDTYNYWYFDTITGKLSAEGIDILDGQINEEFSLEVNYWVYITAARYPTGSDNDNVYLILTREKHGK